jgi:hypothetical protein
MPGCARPTDAFPRLLLAAVLLFSGCASPSGKSRFEIESVHADWSNGRLHISCQQKLALSDEARKALIHGVPLTMELDFILRDREHQSRVAKFARSFEIRYLPLSEHFQVTDLFTRETRIYPRLRHALSWLSRLQLSFKAGIVPAGEYQLLARSRLDLMRMPPPMRLPALFSAQWKHDSSWSAWTMEIHSGA